MMRARPAGGPERLASENPIRGARPDEPSWRADAFSGSRHSRWLAEVREPLDNHDLASARRVCGQVCRLALRDFAPSLVLLTPSDRSRIQALTAYAMTLFDFVRQSGLEGERLAAINRWQFDLESALEEGAPPGQPVFVLLHHLDQIQPWPREAFDRLHGLARRRCSFRRPVDSENALRDAVSLAEPLVWLLLGTFPDEEVSRWLAALIRLQGLTTLGDNLRRHRPPQPLSELSHARVTRGELGPENVMTTIAHESERIRQLGGEGDISRRLPAAWRPAARFCHLGAVRILRRVEDAGPRLLDAPPRLSLFDRLWLLMRSRIG